MYKIMSFEALENPYIFKPTAINVYRSPRFKWTPVIIGIFENRLPAVFPLFTPSLSSHSSEADLEQHKHGENNFQKLLKKIFHQNAQHPSYNIRNNHC